MKLVDLINNPAELKQDCVFCKTSIKDIGFKDRMGAIKVYSSGKDIKKDWYAMLQPSVFSDPATGFRLLLVPTGHITSFAEMNKNPELAMNYGVALAKLSYAMQMIREKEAKIDFTPKQIVYAKCYTAENTQEHLHFKLDEPSDGLEQAFPPDAGWLSKERFGLDKENKEKCLYLPNKIGGYTLSRPAQKTRLSKERIEELAQKLIAYCS